MPNDDIGENAQSSHQDPFVERLRPDPAARPLRTLTFSGLAGASDRPGYRRLYMSRDLERYIEFRVEDVVEEERIPAAEPPVLGLEATRIHVRRDATIDQIRSRAAVPVDEFDLDVRLGSPSTPGLMPNQTWAGDCTWGTDCGGGETAFGITCGGTCDDTCQITLCRGRTCADNCETQIRTCDTCQTQCDAATCQTCNQATCQTCNQATCQTCNQATCQTCNQATCQTCQTCATNCGQGTCQTCATDCGGRTCVTCDTCNPHIPTCGRQCA